MGKNNMTENTHHSSQFSPETEHQLMLSRIKALEHKVAKMEDEKNHTLVWGIRTLCGLLLGLGVWVYNLVSTGKH